MTPVSEAILTIGQHLLIVNKLTINLNQSCRRVFTPISFSLLLLLMLVKPVWAQQVNLIRNDTIPPLASDTLLLPIETADSLVIETADSLVIENQVRPLHSPTKAAMLSATLPGLGQIYNRKYWKVPLVYAGFGAVIYYLDKNNREYQKYRRAWVARVDGNPNTVDDFPHSTDLLQRATNFYRRNLEITYISAAALYLLTILDATVDAHLIDFDVSEDLTMSVRPALISPGLSGYDLSPPRATGITLTFRF